MTVGPRCTVAFNERNKQLARLLGFTPGDYVGFEMKSKECEATRPFGRSGSLFFVYFHFELVEFSYVGDTMVPCLRTLPVIPGEDKITVLRFENPHYLRVASSRFCQVSIEIANDHGGEIRFAKGLPLMKLHFRTKKK